MLRPSNHHLFSHLWALGNADRKDRYTQRLSHERGFFGPEDADESLRCGISSSQPTLASTGRGPYGEDILQIEAELPELP